jgi:hypothetical protein
MLNIKKFWTGIRLVAKSVLQSDTKGELEVEDSSGKLNYHNGSTRSPVVTESHSATLTNKTLTSPVIDTGVSGTAIDVDGTLSSAVDTKVPSALAVKTYVDASSGDVQADVDDLITLSGVAANSTDLGTFTGSTIPDNSDNKEALQALETGLEDHINDASDAHDASAISNAPAGTIAATDVQAAINELDGDIQAHINDTSDAHDASAISNVPSGNLAATDVQGALNELQSDIDTRATSSALTAHTGASTGVHGVVGSVVGTTDSQTLTNKIITGADIRTPIRSDVKQDTKANLITYALTASNGQLCFATDTKEMFQVVDTLLESVGGSAGIGGVDILFAQTFEEAALTDFTQTGLSLSTSSPLHGEISALLTHDSVSNQSFKQVIPVDAKFRGESMTMRLNVKSNASDGNVTLNVYDETNAANLIASEQLQLSNDVSGQLNKFGFTIPETCASLSYTITALPEAGSPETRIDDIIAELAVTSLLSTSVEVPNITAWQGYTPTFQGFGTPSAVEFEWRQVGEDVEIRGKFTSGTPTAVEARIGLPAGLTSASTALIPSLQQVGVYARGGSAVSHHGSFMLQEPSVSYMTMSTDAFGSGSIDPLAKALGNAILLAGNILSITAKVPCAGLSATTTKSIDLTQSGLVQEGDSVLRLRTFNAYASTATRIPRFSNVDQNLGSSLQYNSSATDGDSITVLENGTYTFNFSFSANSTHSIALSRNPSVGERATNASSLTGAVILNRQSGIPGNQSTTVSWSGELNSGDVIYPHTEAVVSSGGNEVRAFFSASKQGSLKQVSVSSDQKIKIPTSELRMEGASSRGAVATAIVRFDNVAKVRGDAFTITSTANDGTFITMRKAGRLDITASFAAPSATTVYLSKNQQVLTAAPAASETLAGQVQGLASAAFVSCSYSGDVAVGDVIRVNADANPTSIAANNLNLSFQEQDISVSVTNTLPQFSESDSSVRLNVANGFGSTATSTMRFAILIENLGSDIEYVDSASNGATFTAKSAGLYSISATVQGSGGVTSFGITRNAVGNESVATLGAAGSALLLDWTSESDGTFNNVEQIGGQYRLGQGDVIRLQSNSAPITNSNIRFSISKVGKPNVTGVDVTPFVNVPQPEVAFIRRSANPTAFGGTDTRIVRFANSVESKGSAIAVTDTAANGTIITALKKGKLSLSTSLTFNGVAGFGFIAKNISGADLTNTDSSGNYNVASSYTAATSNNVQSMSWEGDVEIGDTFRVKVITGTAPNGYSTISASFTGNSDQILTAPETFSTDTASLTYAGSGTYTLATLANAPVGTFITFTYAASTNTRTQTTVAPTQTTADMNTNGIRMFTRVFSAASTAGNPSCMAIQIGKGLKGRTLDLYKSTGKVTQGTVDTVYIATDVQSGFTIKEYNEITGILIIDSGRTLNGSGTTTNVFTYSDLTSQTDGYLVINASKNPALTGLGLGTVAVRVQNTSGQSIPNTGAHTITYDAAKVYDTHGAMNAATGIFTAPESGYYQVSGALYFNSAVYVLANSASLSLSVNGVFHTYLNLQYAERAASIDIQLDGSVGVFLKRGDTLNLAVSNGRTGGATPLFTGANYNYLTIHKTSIGTGN